MASSAGGEAVGLSGKRNSQCKPEQASRLLTSKPTMASEEPPSIRHTPPDTSTRLPSAPAAVDTAVKAPVVNMDTAVDGASAPQAVAQNAGSDHGANGDLPAATGNDEKQTFDTAAPSAIKVEPDSGASGSQNIPSIPPNETPAEAGNSLLKEEEAPAAASDPETQQKPDTITLDNIQKLIDETDLAKLEAGVDEALVVLDKLQAPLADSKPHIQREWLATTNKLQQRSNKTRTVVAVVGETGAGKTSLINALLDEDKLLVTSGWRACTAVICEISYNDMDDPQKTYRAEIEFVSQESWDHELQLLESNLVEDNKLSSEKSDSKTEAGVAYAKIKAVYPDLTDSMIVHHTAKTLAKRASVAEVLGTTRRIECGNASALCSAVQKYTDSKEKSTKTGPKSQKDMAFWPLIKVVRIFCRAEALSTGLVVVDLPGVADSNPARSAIASKYMTECTAIWVVAPIKRATDNKAAKELMGKSSRLQMKLDGIYANVTFICTMTDAIEFAEALDQFDDDGQIRAKNSREDEVHNTIKEKGDALKRLEIQIQESERGISELEREVKAWRVLRKKHQKGHPVYPPQVPSKRKRPEKSQKTRTRRQVIDEDSDDDEEEVEQPPLTTNDISTKLDGLINRLNAGWDAQEDMQRQCGALREELINMDQEKNDAAVDAARLCVQRRNEVVKKAIGVDFAAGIKDLDIADAQDDENFDPSVEIRDYDVVARSLPVFTISAKAYQQICRPKKRETPVAGFRTLRDTEIPQLVEHALQLPEKGRVEVRRRFLNEVRKLLGSLTIWCTAADDQLGYTQMSAEEQSWEMRYLKMAMENLQKKLDLAIVAQQKELENIVSKEIEAKSNYAIKQAAKAIGGIVEKWPLKKDVGGRGIHPMTYRAVCRNKGAKTKGPTSFDFNEAILEPYLEKLVNGWEQAFLRSIPSSLDKFVTTFTDLLSEFHSDMAARQELQKCKKASMRILSNQLDIHSKSIESTIQSMKAGIQTEQRNVNRAFADEIQQEMMKTYERCGKEKGPGCTTRVKEIMMQHIAKQKSATYRKASKRVLKELNKVFESNREELTDSAHTIIEALQKDFEMILSNSEVLEASEVARDHIRGVLRGVDARFGAILSGDPMKVDSAQPPACDPQRLPDASMADAVRASGEVAEAAPGGEDVAMDTAL